MFSNSFPYFPRVFMFFTGTQAGHHWGHRAQQQDTESTFTRAASHLTAQRHGHEHDLLVDNNMLPTSDNTRTIRTLATTRK